MSRNYPSSRHSSHSYGFLLVAISFILIGIICNVVDGFTSVTVCELRHISRTPVEIYGKAETSRDEGLTSKHIKLSPTAKVTSNKNRSTDKNKQILYTADIQSSKKTQKNIQREVERLSKTKRGNSYTASISVLDVLLKADPYHEVNEMNILYALISSVKFLPSSPKISDTDSQKQFQRYFSKLSHIIDTLLCDDENPNEVQHGERLSTRQLANAAWALVKALDHLSFQGKTWDLTIYMLERIAAKITNILDECRKSEVPDLTFSGIELSMIAGAYTHLRPRDRPVGWKYSTNQKILERGNSLDRAMNNENAIRFESLEFSNSFDRTITFDTYDDLFEAIANDITREDHSLENYEWGTLSNILWAFASRGHNSLSSELLAKKITKEITERLALITNEKILKKPPLSRDISILAWSLGVMQADNFRLGESFEEYIYAVSKAITEKSWKTHEYSFSNFSFWSSSDLVQLASSLAHGRVDDISLLEKVFVEAVEKVNANKFKMWEIVVLIWTIAKLDLTHYQSASIDRFLTSSVDELLQRMKNLSAESGSIKRSRLGGLGSQEQANLAWSLTVLEFYTPESLELLQLLFHAAVDDGCMKLQPEHAHQLWQALFVLEKECPSTFPSVPMEFRKFLRQKWSEEKNRKKDSSARHKALSDTLTLMGITHFNEYDEDIDVAMILPQKSTAITQSHNDPQNHSLVRHVAVEFDGPSHFVRGGRRPLGETLLKYRLLKLQGWDVVRVPYQEFDKIPFWASMERQRYVQRILKTHESIRFSDKDVSDYSEIPEDRRSRFD